MEIPVPFYCDLFVKEILNPFFVFQIYSVLLWSYEENYAFAIVITTVTTISSKANLISIKQNIIKIKEMANNSQTLKVKRNNVF